MTTTTKPTIDELRKSLPEREIRSFESASAKDEDGELRLGLFVPFKSQSVDLGGFTEEIAPGAFRRTLKNSRNIVALWQHDHTWVIGAQGNDTLALRETDDGLDATATLDAKNPLHVGFHRSVALRYVTGTSFGFQAVRDEWENRDDGSVHRTLLEVKLFEVSAVTFPAYEASQAKKRGTVDAIPIEVLSVGTGLNLRDLAALLASATDGKVPLDQHGALRSWVQRLEGFLPEVTAPALNDWAARLAISERIARGAPVAKGLAA